MDELYKQLIDLLDKYTTKKINVNDIPFMVIRSTISKINPIKEYSSKDIANIIITYHTKLKPMVVRNCHMMYQGVDGTKLSEIIELTLQQELVKLL